MKLVLDSGAFIALERNDRPMWRRLKNALLDGTVPATHGGIIGQVWRAGRRQVLLAKALQAVDVTPLDGSLGRRAGELLAASKRQDVVDAALVLLANDGDTIVTSDLDDIEPLALAADRDVELLRA